MSRRRILVITALATALVVALAGGLAGARALQPQASHPSHATTASQPARAAPAGQPATVGAAAIPLRFFTLVAFTYNGNAQTLTRNATITLVFDPAHHALGGRAGCNGYGGYYALAADRLRLDGIGYTQMRCLSPRVMAQEARYLEAFARVTTYHLDASGLTLSDDTGAYVLRFA